MFQSGEINIPLNWAEVVVVVKWLECSPSTPTIRVQIPLKSTILQKWMLKRTKINKTRPALTI